MIAFFTVSFNIVVLILYIIKNYSSFKKQTRSPSPTPEDHTTPDPSKKQKAQYRETAVKEQLVQSNKMIQLGICVSGMMHEIDNPNNCIMMNAGVLRILWAKLKPLLFYIPDSMNVEKALPMSMERVIEEMDFLINSIEKASQRIRHIVTNVKKFSRQEDPVMDQYIALGDLINSSLTIAGNLVSKSTHNFSIDIEKNLPFIRGNFQRLEQVIINILTNACQALTKKSDAIVIRGFRNKECGSIELEISDTGKGMSEEIRSQIFNPFFTTRKDSGGTGLGLSISYDIIKEHGAEFLCESKEGKGTVMKIFFPI